LNRKAGKGISGAEGKVYKISSARLRQKIKIEVDTLDYTTEKVLSMEYEDRKWRLVTCLLKSLNKTKKNYEIYLEFGQIIKT